MNKNNKLEYEKTCVNCKYADKTQYEYPCKQCCHNFVDNFKNITRYDVFIKEYTIEDWAEEISEFIKEKCNVDFESKAVLEWLKEFPYCKKER